MLRILILLLILSPLDSGRREYNTITRYCDLVEVNSHIDQKGRHTYDQIIFWEWNPVLKKMVVCSWTLVSEDESNIPSRVGKRYVFRREYKREKRKTIIIYADLFRKTTSRIDPEKENKKIFPEKLRRDLFTKE